MQLPLLSLDPSKPLKHFDRDEMLREAQDCQKKDDEQLEALLADLDQLKQDVLTCLQKTLSRLITQQQKVVGEEVQEVVQKEEQEAVSKKRICIFLDEVSSSVAKLLGTDPLPAAPEPSKPSEPLLLVNPHQAARKYDVDELTRKLEVEHTGAWDELEAILRDVTELFDAFTVSFYRAFRRTTETYTADLNNALSTTKAREEEQELERLRIQKLLDDVHTAFAGFPKF